MVIFNPRTIVSIPDLRQARRFLKILAGPKPVTFQTFSDRDNLKAKRPDGTIYDPNARIRHGTLATKADIALLEHLNAKGAGVYVMVNAGDGKGRAAKNVQQIRALFVDSDGAPFPDPLRLQPHLVVRSSPGRWHLYWKAERISLADFSTLQEALAEHYGTDMSIKDLPRVMRLPGFYHHKSEPFIVQLLEASGHPPYSFADILNAWPFLGEHLERKRALEAEREQRRSELTKATTEHRVFPSLDSQHRKRALALLAAHFDRVASAGDGSRHETLKESAYTLGGYVSSGYLERVEVENDLLRAAEVCGLPDGEATDVIRWGLDKGADKPLEFTDNFHTLFGANSTFSAEGGAPKLLRPSLSITYLVQSGGERKGEKPQLGGKPCL